jgi:hypothetical protein
MFLANHFTRPLAIGTVVGSGVKDVGVAAMQFAVAHYQNATDFNVHTINGNSGQRIESVLNHDCFRSQPPEIVADFGKIVTEARTSGRTPGGDNSEAVLRCGA